jgi:mannose-1-phosphate guanylyltransferase
MIIADFKNTTSSAHLPQVRGIVLAGAYSWSNSAFDRQMPRPLMPVAGRPLISYAIGWLHEGGVDNAVVCTNRDTRNLQARLAAHIRADFKGLVYREDPMPRGTAGCARDAAAESDADTVIVTDGTAIPSADLGDLLRQHWASGAALTVVVHRAASRHGGSTGQEPCGIYIVERRALDLVKAVGYVDIKENLIPLLYEAGEPVLTNQTAHPSPRVLDLATYLSANERMIQRLADRDGAVALKARGAVVATDAVLIGPVLLGRGVSVMSGATIIGPTSIGDGSVVKSGALVSRSAIWSHCVIETDAMADRCLLADGAVLEARMHEVGAVKAGRARQPRQIPARDSTSFAELLRRRFAAKAIRDRARQAGRTAAAS